MKASKTGFQEPKSSFDHTPILTYFLMFYFKFSISLCNILALLCGSIVRPWATSWIALLLKWSMSIQRNLPPEVPIPRLD